jgi:predicted aminopeptidase
MSWGRAFLGCFLALSLVGCGACSPLYILEGAVVQGRILLSREPLSRVLNDPNLSEVDREKLELVQAARVFAADTLRLKVGDAYGTYAEVPDGALVWVVSAARQTELESYRWWFPIVGSVTYKGFFEKQDAEELAASLDEQGWDTYVRPSSAFSTLGWFDDPVLSNWLTRDDVALVDLVLHELVHRSFYRSGQTDFNESFATWAGRVGTYEFFRSRDGEESANAKLAGKRLELSFEGSAQWRKRIDALRDFYRRAARAEWPLAKVLEDRGEFFRPFGAAAQMNNAVILARWAYRKDLRDFRCARQASGDSLAVALAATWERSLAAKDPFAAIRCQGIPAQAVAAPEGCL